ncbi:MAG: class I SAM-dependent methyltransferase, partial [Planctomycetaceae bacterium]
RRSGKNILYGLLPASGSEATAHAQLLAIVDSAAREIPECARDRDALVLALKKRGDTARAYFDQLAGKFGRNYVAGRSWKGLAEMLLRLMDPKVIADLGAGEGTLSQLLAQRAERVIAVDNSEKMVEFGAKLACEHGFANLEYRLGDIERIPIGDATVDLAIFSQALHHANMPRRAVEEAFRILRPGGRIVVLDLLKHSFEDARSLYADVWLGFSEVEILEFFRKAGFTDPETALVDRETESPHFQTLLAIARKPSSPA